VGYEQDLEEIARDFTIGAQYYLQMRIDHDAWEAARPPFMPDANRERHMVTLRLTKLLLSPAPHETAAEPEPRTLALYLLLAN